jgi:hypothetical protein
MRSEGGTFGGQIGREGGTFPRRAGEGGALRWLGGARPGAGRGPGVRPGAAQKADSRTGNLLFKPGPIN